MTSSPLFSVLVANFNNGRFLQQAIDSVYAQTYSNWEIILVDDGSTDNSHKLYEHLNKDNRIHIYYNDRNRGCGYTKHRCAELANGEICGFLDPDDELLPRAIESMVNVHVSHPEVSIVYSRSYYCDSSGIIVGENRLLKLKEGETYLDYRWYGSMCLAAYKKAFYDMTEGISANIEAGVDQDLYFKVEENGVPFVLNEFTYKYYNHRNENSLTGYSNRAKLWYWNLEVRKNAFKRRGKDADAMACEDFRFILDRACAEAAYEKEVFLKKTLSYRLGRFLLKPLLLIRKKLLFLLLPLFM